MDIQSKYRDRLTINRIINLNKYRLVMYYIVDCILWMAAVVVPLILAAAYLDWNNKFTPATRLAILLLIIISAIAILIIYIIKVLLSISPSGIAGKVEREYSSLDGRLITSVDIMNQRRTMFDEKIIDLLLSDTAYYIKKLSIESVIKFRKILKAGLVSGIVIFICIYFYNSKVNVFKQHVKRILFPYRKIEPVFKTILKVEPGDITVNENNDVMVKTFIEGEVPPELKIYYSIPNIDFIAENMNSMTNKSYSFNFRSVNIPIRYYVTAGDAVSGTYTIEVVKPPRVKKIETAVMPPQYTGIKNIVNPENKGNIKAPEGSIAVINIETNKTVYSGNIVITATAGKNHTEKIPLMFASDNNYTCTFVLNRTGQYYVSLKDNKNLINDNPVVYPVEVMKDEKPEVEIINPGRDTKQNRIAEITVNTNIRDDYGIRYAVLKYMYKDTEGEIVRKEFNGITADTFFKADIYLEEFEFQYGDLLAYYVETNDSNPLTYDTPVKSKVYFIEITPFEEKWIFAEPGTSQSTLMKSTAKILRMQKKAFKKSFSGINNLPGKDNAEITKIYKRLSEVQNNVIEMLDYEKDKITKDLKKVMHAGAAVQIKFEKARKYMVLAVSGFDSQDGDTGLFNQRKAITELVEIYDNLIRLIGRRGGRYSNYDYRDEEERMRDIYDELSRNRKTSEIEFKDDETKKESRVVKEILEEQKEIQKKMKELMIDQVEKRSGMQDDTGLQNSAAGQAGDKKRELKNMLKLLERLLYLSSGNLDRLFEILKDYSILTGVRDTVRKSFINRTALLSEDLKEKFSRIYTTRKITNEIENESGLNKTFSAEELRLLRRLQTVMFDIRNTLNMKHTLESVMRGRQSSEGIFSQKLLELIKKTGRLEQKEKEELITKLETADYMSPKQLEETEKLLNEVDKLDYGQKEKINGLFNSKNFNSSVFQQLSSGNQVIKDNEEIIKKLFSIKKMLELKVENNSGMSGSQKNKFRNDPQVNMLINSFLQEFGKTGRASNNELNELLGRTGYLNKDEIEDLKMLQNKMIKLPEPEKENINNIFNKKNPAEADFDEITKTADASGKERGIIKKLKQVQKEVQELLKKNKLTDEGTEDKRVSDPGKELERFINNFAKLNKEEYEVLKNRLNSENLLPEHTVDRLNNVKSKTGKLSVKEKNMFNNILNKTGWTLQDKRDLVSLTNLSSADFKALSELKELADLVRNSRRLNEADIDMMRRLSSLSDDGFKNLTDKLVEKDILKKNGVRKLNDIKEELNKMSEKDKSDFNRIYGKNDLTRTDVSKLDSMLKNVPGSGVLLRKLNLAGNNAARNLKGRRGNRLNGNIMRNLATRQKKQLRRLDNFQRLLNKRNKRNGNVNAALGAMLRTTQYQTKGGNYRKDLNRIFANSSAVIDELLRLEAFFLQNENEENYKSKLKRLAAETVPGKFKELVDRYFKALAQVLNY